MKKIVLLLILAGAAAGGWFFFQHNGAASGLSAEKPAFSKPPVPVSTATTTRRDMPLTLDAVGTVVTGQSVDLKARVDSQVLSVHFKDGDEVEEGALLFTLDSRPIEAQLRQLQANLARDKAQLGDSTRQLERKRGLADKGYETTANLDEARTLFEVQKAAVSAGEAGIDSLKTQMEYTKIHAPISGRTGTINVTAGNTVKANDAAPLVTINQMKPIRVQVSIPQKHLAPLRQAMAAGTVTIKATVEGGRSVSSGVLEYVDNAIDGTTGTFIARASFPNEDETLWPGMYVSTTILLGQQQNTLVIPEIAVQHTQDGDFVFVIADGKAQKRPVEISAVQDSLSIVSKGLAAGDIVATDGILRLEDGSDVTVITEQDVK